MSVTGLLKRVLPRAVSDRLHRLRSTDGFGRFAAGLGLHLRAPHEDRRCLEEVILPWFAARPEFRRVLFVGCDWYSSGYHRIFRDGEYATLDFDPGKRRYGARRHFVGPMQELGRWFPAEKLDLIVCNGVFGWGLDAKPDVETAFRASFEALRPGGVLIIGWNDMPEHRPFPLEESEALARFAPLVFEPLGATRVPMLASPFRHVFDFYRKPATVVAGVVST